MFGEKFFSSKVFAFGIIGAFLLLLCCAEAGLQTTEGTGSFKGYIYNEDSTTPLENAVVKMRDTEDKEEKQSLSTDDSGAYEIKDIKEGRYVIGVTTTEGNFNFDYTVGIKANETAKLSMVVKRSDTKPAGILFLRASGRPSILGIITLLAPSEPTGPAKKKR